MSKEQANITHICVVVDASSSMSGLRDAVVRVIDGLVEQWKRQSLDLDDMTRMTLYQFSSRDYPLPSGEYIECIWYDTDITRIKSLTGRYTPYGNTALIDATIQAQGELAQTSTLYGNHTFLFFVITDGDENKSRNKGSDLAKVLDNLPDNWTVAALVPGIQGKIAAQRYGFPPGNIDVWDATSERGVEEVGERIAQATSSYMRTRSTNASFKGTRSLFVGGQVDAAAIKAAKLKPLDTDAYAIVPVTPVQGLVQEKPDPALKKPPAGQPDNRPLVAYMEIEPFIQRVRPPFRIGECYYELVKTETIRGNKQLAILDRKTSKVYLGDGVRKMLGLPEENKTVRPDFNKDYKIYVQSTSLNRHLYLHSSVMVLTK